MAGVWILAQARTNDSRHKKDNDLIIKVAIEEYVIIVTLFDDGDVKILSNEQ